MKNKATLRRMIYKDDYSLKRLAAAEYLQAFDAAKLLGISPTTFTRWQQKGKLQGVKFGNKIFYNTASLLKQFEIKEEK